MGQKLEKLSEKDDESLDNSDWSRKTEETEQSETAQKDESRDQEAGSFTAPLGIGWISVSGSSTGTTVTSAHTDPQTGQPIRPLGQQEHPLNTSDEWVGGDRESRSVTRTAEESTTALSPEETRPTSNKRQGSESKAVVYTGTTAMEEQGNGKKSDIGRSKLGSDIQTRSLTSSFNPGNEDDFVVLEKDETWMSSDGDIILGRRIKTENLQSPIKRRVEEDASASGVNLSQTSRYAPQEQGNERKSRRRSDTLPVATDSVEAHAETSPEACFEREMGQHLPEVTGSRCRLKAVDHVGAVHAGTTGRGRAEREQNMNNHSKGKVSNMGEEHLSTRHSSFVKRSSKSSEDLEDMLDEAGQFLTHDKGRHDSEFVAQKIQAGAVQSHQSRFAGAVATRAKAGSLCTKEEDGRVLCKAADYHPSRSETPPLRDNSSLSLKRCNSFSFPPLPETEGCDGKMQVASITRESKLVCFSAVITPPPLTHLLPKRGATMQTQLGTSMGKSQMVADASCDSKDESMPKEKLKVKGPPPPVPKKPKNPFIKLKTAQLKSTDVQRRGKDNLRSAERVKRRHTFDFYKDLPSNTPTNQDMCLLWDQRGASTAPFNARRLSVDLSPWEQLSLGHMDDQYGAMIDYEYCVRVANLSPEEEPHNLDMLQRREFLERRSRFKSSPPPPVAKKTSTETLHKPEVTPNNEIQRLKPARSWEKEIYPEHRSERVSNDNQGNYGQRKDHHSSNRNAGGGGEVGSYKPVAKIIKETNQLQRHQSKVKPEGAKAPVRVAEEGPSVKVSQMKNAFDVPRKSKERPPEEQQFPKKGKDFTMSRLETSVLSVFLFLWCIYTEKAHCVCSSTDERVLFKLHRLS